MASAAVMDLTNELIKLGAEKRKIESLLETRIRELESELHQAKQDTIQRTDIAEWLHEAPDSNAAFLEQRVRGYVRFASRRGAACISCGGESTARLTMPQRRRPAPADVRRER